MQLQPQQLAPRVLRQVRLHSCLMFAATFILLATVAAAGMPLTPNAFQASGGFWMCVLANSMTQLFYASYFGAGGDHIDGGTSRMDPQGIVYHSICTSSTTQPTTPGSWSPTKLTGGYDIASWKFDFQAAGVTAGFSISNGDTFCMPAVVNCTNTSANGQTYLWNFGDGSPTSTLATPPTHTYTIPGAYQISLYAYNSNANNCKPVDSVFHNIYVRGDSVHAQAALTTNDSGCIAYTVAFSNTTTDATSYEWDWGDGSSVSTTAAPTHTYSNTGTYTIRFIATNPLKCRPHDTLNFVVTALIPGAHAAFTITGPDTICRPASVQVNNASTGSTNYVWDFGDGTPTVTGTTPPPHIFMAPGNHRIKLMAYNSNYWACIPVDSAFHTVYIRSDSVHAHGALTTNDSGCAPYTVAFTNTSTSATSYEWIWGDGSPNSTVLTPSHTYVNTGTYTIKLIAINPLLCYQRDTISFVVTSLIPGAHAAFTTNADTMCLPASIQVTNNSTGSTNYLWDFGDGTPTTTAATPPAHAYTATGLYTIKLMAYNNNYWACIPVDSAFHRVYIRLDSVHAHAALTTNDSGCVPYNVAFSNTTTDAASYVWIWGDGTANSTTATPTHTYPNPGTYTITFIANNPRKCRPADTLTFVVTALDPGPHAIFATTKDSICHGGIVQVTNNSINATDYAWDFGDSSATTTDVNPPAHTYKDSGTYVIKLLAYNHNYWACIPMDSATHIIHVYDMAMPVIGVKDVMVCIPDDTADLKVIIANKAWTMDIAWEPSNLIYSDPTLANVKANSWHKQEFTVTVTNSMHGLCPVDTTVGLLVTPIPCDDCMWFPNAFTPNFDGHNDKFGAVTRCPVTHFNLNIYNRWGQLMFTGFYPEAHWDGTYNTDPMPLGTYFYSFSYQAVDGRTVTGKGDVTLIR